MVAVPPLAAHLLLVLVSPILIHASVLLICRTALLHLPQDFLVLAQALLDAIVVLTQAMVQESSMPTHVASNRMRAIVPRADNQAWACCIGSLHLDRAPPLPQLGEALRESGAGRQLPPVPHTLQKT